MSAQTLQPYLFFSGRCEEALEFYRSAIGAEVLMLMRYNESPDPTPPGMLPPGYENKVMHSTVKVGQTTFMASDGCETALNFSGFKVALAYQTEAEAQAAFHGLSAGGQIEMPLMKTFWSPCFGMLTDRFGVAWMVTVVA
jgi:PhnB protein